MGADALAPDRQSLATTKLRGVVIAGSAVVLDRRSSNRVEPAVAVTHDDMVLRVVHRHRTGKRTQGDPQAQGQQRTHRIRSNEHTVLI